MLLLTATVLLFCLSTIRGAYHLKNNRLLKSVGAETVNTVSLLATVCDTLSAAYGLLFSAGLSERHFSVPAPISGGVVLLTLRKIGCRKIISHSAGHSVVIGVWATKKSRHINVYRPIQKDRLIPCGFWFHNDVTGFEIQSRNCLLRLTSADSSRWQWQRRHFLFAYRRRVRCKAVLPNSVKICNWLWFS